MGEKSASPMHIHIFNKLAVKLKTMNAKTTKKSPIHENADANIICDFGDGLISRSRTRLPHTRTQTHIVSSIIFRYQTGAGERRNRHIISAK